MLHRKEVPFVVPSSEHVDFAKNLMDFGEDYRFVYPQWEMKLPEEWSIVAIIGDSGTGKSSLLKSLSGEEFNSPFDSRPIVEHIHPNPEEAVKALQSVGLNSIPSWFKPYKALSTGERYRAYVAQQIANLDLIILDEFTSVLDRESAISLSNSLFKYIKRSEKRLIIASCHYDILEWLKPCYVYNLNRGLVSSRRWERQPIKIGMSLCHRSYWKHFAPYHYLNEEIATGAICALIYWGQKIVGFAAWMALPHANLKNAYRSHRVVALPQYQGMGIGSKIEDLVGDYIVGKGGRYYAKTAHPILGYVREKSPKWRATKWNKRKTAPSTKWTYKNKWMYGRLTYSHEYIAESSYEPPKPNNEQLSLFGEW